MSQAQILPADHFSPSVSIHNGRPATTSLEVAKFFGKRHDHVLRSINDLIANTPKEFTAPNFGVSEYTDETGRVLPMFILHRDGFMLLVMGYTGKKAMQIKVAYILAFNKMEAQIAGNALPPPKPTALTPSTADDRKPLRSLVAAWAQVSGTPHQALWPQVKAHFQLARIDDLPMEWIGDALAFVQGKIDAAGKALPAAPENTEFLPTMFPTFEKDILDIERLIERLCNGMSIFARPGGMMHREFVRNKPLIDAVQPCISAAKNAVGTGYFMMQTARKIYGAMK
ncbi:MULTISPECIES: Rha family transcriptional regulator [Desulfovibrio]|uniref:Phage regulatory protein, rha family n=1 Tax=Desulfovibrio desulfuricans TaxID=876 RepID=A0AA94HQX3_DESDE|nr:MULTISPECIES: Rha family transcriptional regulator [Desulfovibrio]ATD81158.1 hypothetical protein CNY67_07010 [Desulfovibrio sp. G11]SFW22639.1 phage regulatory protein, rha family [Desulfovibrio desulfuricans]SPD36778.1 Phage regulatory protein, Rha family [Desulfovibrio sp. G11]